MKDKNEQNVYVREFYSLQQLADDLSYNPRVLKQFIQSGKLQGIKIGKKYIVTREQVYKFLEDNKEN